MRGEREGVAGEEGRSSCEEETPEEAFPIEADEGFPCVPDEGRHSIPDEGTDGEEGELPTTPTDTTWSEMRMIHFILRVGVTWFWFVSGEVRILLAGLLWLPLLVGLFELRTKVLVTRLTEPASFSHDSFRSDTCQIYVSNMASIVLDMLDKMCDKYILMINIISHLCAELWFHGLTS